MELEQRLPGTKTFLDCDDLNDLTRLFSYVGQAGTHGTVPSHWLFDGRSGSPTVLLLLRRCPSWQALSAALLKHLPVFHPFDCEYIA